MSRPKIVVIDDDPTGSQTVHSCLLLMRWDVATLRLGLADAAPIFFILANTRALTPEQAEARTREVCQNLQAAIAAEGIQDFLVVSRSDSTLRGHYPIETDAIAAELGPFDAHFLTPAFFEGGRFTRQSVHYLLADGQPVPTHETEFARDSVFGYSTAYLPDYVAEKTQGKIPAEAVARFLLADIREGCRARLEALTDNQCAAVDAETQADLDRFADDLLAVAARGKRFLFRSAASLLTSLAQLGPQPVPAEAMARYARSSGRGVVVVGSHVRKSTQQLQALLAEPTVTGIEVEVARLRDFPEQRAAMLAEAIAAVRASHAGGQTPVVYTSRQELQFESVRERLDFGAAVSSFLMAVIRGLPADLGFLVSKGGITSNDTLSDGLNLRAARLLGQVLPGVSLVRAPADHPQFPDLPVVLFPGNVGDERGLVTVVSRLSGS